MLIPYTNMLLVVFIHSFYLFSEYKVCQSAIKICNIKMHNMHKVARCIMKKIWHDTTDKYIHNTKKVYTMQTVNN